MKEGGSPTTTPAGNASETASRVSGLLLSVAPAMNPNGVVGGRSDRNKMMDVKNRDQMEYMTERTLIRDYIPYPRFLLDMNLNQTARILYALLLDRSKISRNNGWKNEKGYIYVIYPIMDLEQVLGKSHMTIKKALNELEDAELLVRKNRDFQNRICCMSGSRQRERKVSL